MERCTTSLRSCSDPGVGKPHLATAPGRNAIRRRHKALFARADKLFTRLDIELGESRCAGVGWASVPVIGEPGLRWGPFASIFRAGGVRGC